MSRPPDVSRRKAPAALLLVALFLVAVVVVVARLPTPASSAGGTGSGTAPPQTGRAAIGVYLELPPAGTSTTTTTTTTAKSHATTTTVRPGLRPVTGASIEPVLRREGFDVVGVGTEAGAPATTEVQYTPHHLGDALTVRTILRLPETAVGPYAGPAGVLPAAVDVVVLVGTSG